jgi:Sorting nexin C terminal
MILLALQKITDSLWPNGERAPPKEARKHELQMKEREEANRKLSTWLPGKEAVRMTSGQPRCNQHTEILHFRHHWQYGRAAECTKRC